MYILLTTMLYLLLTLNTHLQNLLNSLPRYLAVFYLQYSKNETTENYEKKHDWQRPSRVSIILATALKQFDTLM